MNTDGEMLDRVVIAEFDEGDMDDLLGVRVFLICVASSWQQAILLHLMLV